MAGGPGRADLAPVLLDQDSHGHHQSAAGGVEYAAGGLDDDHRVAVFLGYCSQEIADRLTAAGVPGHRLRNVGAAA
jgi:hypothetical protein